MCDMIIMNNEHIYIQRLKLRFYFIKREIRKGVKRLHTHTQTITPRTSNATNSTEKLYSL